jgi:predicted outer membrane repeat protein
MKSRLILFLSLLLFVQISFATDIYSGPVNGNWDQAGSPYLIHGQINIPTDQSLTIEAGVEIIFQDHYKFIVYGKLIAEGTVNDTIVFTAQDTDAGWYGLRFSDTSSNGQDDSILRYCLFEYGNALTGNEESNRGGALSCSYSSNVQIINCRFTNNQADYGGAISLYESDILMQNCLIEYNFASHDAGGILIRNNSAPLLDNIILQNNSCNYDGGGVYVCTNASPIISNSTILGNSCVDWEGAQGGGISIWGANPVLENVIISDNNSVGGGGGICLVQNSSASLTDVVINRNMASIAGGIIIYNAAINLSGVTISENISENCAGGIFFSYDSEIVFDPDNRCNIYCNNGINSNLGDDIYAHNINGCNIIVDTFTVIEPTEYQVHPVEDFTFDIQNGMIEAVNADLYVNPTGDNNNSGLTADDPLKNIFYALQKIIGEESNPVSIFLANGTYSPSQTNESYFVLCKDYVDIIGESRENTILDAEETNRVISSLGTTHSIRNLTIKNGSHPNYRSGGGIYIDGSNIELENLLITSNSSNSRGGGIHCKDSDPILTNVRIENNSANGFNGFGGGIYFEDSNPFLSSVTISNNYAGSGSGIVFIDSNPVFDAENRCNIYNNCSEINYGNDIFLGYYNENIDVFIDTFTVYDPTTTQINYMGKVTIDIQNSIILPIDADIFVSPAGSDENSGLTPDDPFKTISFAVNSITSNEDNPKNIYLDEGIYSTSNTGEQFPLSGKDNVQIIGENRETSIIDGESNKGLLLLDTVQNFTLKNMQLTNGNAHYDYYYQYDYGGAISTNNSVLYLDNLIISNNIANQGGGIYNWGSEIEISKTDFIDNLSTGAGGGISSYQSNIKLDRVLFHHNIAESSTGAAINSSIDSNLEVVNCTFFSNDAPSYFGAIYTRNSNTIIVNSILWNDLNNELCIFSAYNEQSTLTIINSNIEGGEDEIYIYGDSNTINWLEYNIETDPLFADTLNGNFNLTENSPCIDMGTAFFEWNGEVIIDLEEEEYFGSAPDMGAYEWDGTPVSDELEVRNYELANYPNPFNPETKILFSIPEESNVELSIYNIKGQKVKQLVSDLLSPDQYSVVWNSKDDNGKVVSSGIYFYKLKAKNKEIIKKMLLLK